MRPFAKLLPTEFVNINSLTLSFLDKISIDYPDQGFAVNKNLPPSDRRDIWGVSVEETRIRWYVSTQTSLQIVGIQGGVISGHTPKSFYKRNANVALNRWPADDVICEYVPYRATG